MSGGHFDYIQYKIIELPEEIQKIIDRNSDVDWYRFSDETIERMKEAIFLSNILYHYIHEIDWMVSGDTGEETFHSRLNKELSNFKDLDNSYDVHKFLTKNKNV